ncbi:MAG TPA: helix-turn-helix domain-containing protein [Burkholderiaceae bacterium]|jgi:transcriptional regulator with XRE-family HTH domain
MHNPKDEKKAFSLRLRQALKHGKKKIETPTELQAQFNLKYQGEGITPQAAQKWLAGETRPTIDKIEILAEITNVSVQWLRFGIADDKPALTTTRKAPKGKTAPPTDEELKLLAKLRTLPEHQRYLVEEIVDQFSLEQEMWRE